MIKEVFKDGKYKRIKVKDLKKYLDEGWILQGALTGRKLHSEEFKQNVAKQIGGKNRILRILKDPEGMTWKTERGLRNFCKKHQLSYNVLIRFEGITLKSSFTNMTTFLAKNTVGWTLLKLPIKEPFLWNGNY